MKSHVSKRLGVARAFDVVRNGKPVDAFEASKWLLKHDRRVQSGHLMKIANDKRCATWNRIAAIHTIGFLRRRRDVAQRLIALLADKQENTKIRGQAAESLASYREKAAIPLLRKILLSTEPPGLKVSASLRSQRCGSGRTILRPSILMLVKP